MQEHVSSECLDVQAGFRRLSRPLIDAGNFAFLLPKSASLSCMPSGPIRAAAIRNKGFEISGEAVPRSAAGRHRLLPQALPARVSGSDNPFHLLRVWRTEDPEALGCPP